MLQLNDNTQTNWHFDGERYVILVIFSPSNYAEKYWFLSLQHLSCRKFMSCLWFLAHELCFSIYATYAFSPAKDHVLRRRVVGDGRCALTPITRVQTSDAAKRMSQGKSAGKYRNAREHLSCSNDILPRKFSPHPLSKTEFFIQFC